MMFFFQKHLSQGEKKHDEQGGETPLDKPRKVNHEGAGIEPTELENRLQMLEDKVDGLSNGN